MRLLLRGGSLANGTITLKSFAELASVLDVESLPPGPAESSEPITIPLHTENPEGLPTPEQAASPEPSSAQPLDLTSLISRLAQVSSDLESMARSDARAREQATIEVAQYETLAAEREQAERALDEARQVRATAESLVNEAFAGQTRVEAARHAAMARDAELTCTQLVAERVRAADELTSRPHLARVLADRRRREQERTDAAERLEAQRAGRLAAGLVAARQARQEGRLDDARWILTPLVRDFPTNPDVPSTLNAIHWQIQHLRVAPAEEALLDVATRLHRDPAAAVRRLAAVDTCDLPDDLARRVFGMWSQHCLRLVTQSGRHDPRRHAPAASRGLIFARRTPDGSYRLISALSLPGWEMDQEVTQAHIIRGSRPLLDRTSRKSSDSSNL